MRILYPALREAAHDLCLPVADDELLVEVGGKGGRVLVVDDCLRPEDHFVAPRGQAKGQFLILQIGEGFVKTTVGQQRIPAVSGRVGVDKIDVALVCQEVVFVLVFYLDEAGDERRLAGGISSFGAGDSRIGEGGGQFGQPPGGWLTISIGETDQLPARGANAAVAGGCRAAARLPDDRGTVTGGNLARLVGRAIVDDDNLVALPV